MNYFYLNELLYETNAIQLHAWNGAEAIEYVESNPNITLIIMDIKMPVMDGYEATRIIKKKRKNIPIIAYTAYAMSNDREKALKAGFDDYVAKPISKDNLIKIINKYLFQSKMKLSKR